MEKGYMFTQEERLHVNELMIFELEHLLNTNNKGCLINDGCIKGWRNND